MNMKRRITLAIAGAALVVGLSACQPGGTLSVPPRFTVPPHFEPVGG